MANASRDLESQAHRLLARWRIHGEWFDLGNQAEAFERGILRCSAENLLAFLGNVSALPALPAGYVYNEWDEALGAGPFATNGGIDFKEPFPAVETRGGGGGNVILRTAN